jgi:hypothetical protein
LLRIAGIEMPVPSPSDGRPPASSGVLRRAAGDRSELVREHARWGLERLEELTTA